jgi:hypothetical protein
MSEYRSNPIGRRGFLRTGVAVTAASTGLITGNVSALEVQSDQAKEQWGGGKPSVLIFDVNETLIDFEVM